MKHSDIIKNIRNRLNLSQTKFADFIDVKNDKINSIENNRSSITDEIAESISEKFPQLELSKDDILLGRLKWLANECVNLSFIEALPDGEIAEIEETYPVPLKDINHYGRDVSDLVLVRIHGHAMATLINDADILVISKADTKVEDGEIYITNYDNELYCRRILNNVTEYILESENPKYTPVYIKGEDRKKLEIVGKVVFRMNRF
jgi:DNA-binding XRE family transcriptional regulator